MHFKELSELIHPVFNTDGRPEDRTDNHTGQDEEHILTLDGPLNPHAASPRAMTHRTGVVNRSDIRFFNPTPITAARDEVTALTITPIIDLLLTFRLRFIIAKKGAAEHKDNTFSKQSLLTTYERPTKPRSLPVLPLPRSYCQSVYLNN